MKAEERDELPEGWEWRSIGALSKSIKTGTTPPSKEERYYGGNVQWFTPGDIGETKILRSSERRITDVAVRDNKARIFEPETLLITCIGNIGRVGILKQSSASNQQITGVRFDDASIDVNFVYWWFVSIRAQLQELAPVAVVPILNQGNLKLVQVPVPYPNDPDRSLDEQRRIVARIEEFAPRVTEAHQHRNEATSAINAWLPSALSTAFEELTDQHGTRPLKGLFTFRNDLLRPTDKATGEVRFIGLQHIESGTGRRIGEDLVWAEQLTGRKFRFSTGEIVYGYLRPYLNKVWIADCDGLCSVDQYVLQPDNAQVDTRYLACAMRSPLFLKQSEQLTGVLTLPRLRSGLLESIEIPVPPLDEQRRIAAHLDALQAKADAIRAAQLETQRELDALMPAVLDRAFRGEL